MAMSEHKSQPSPRSGKEVGADQEADDGVFFVALQFKGTIYQVPVQDEDLILAIFDFVHEVLDFQQENCKLIFKGKTMRLEDASLTSVGEIGLAPGSKVMLLAQTTADIEKVRKIKADPLVKGFDEEERDERNRRKRAKAAQMSAWGTKQDAEYRFGSIKAEFKYSTPAPYEAEKLLQRLATDPGIIEIMKTRRFKVGVLTEMSPVEAQECMAKRGTPNMDLLGYNTNQGDMIVLRLRTDTLKGFRPYHDLINTLIHELTHNVWGPHDQNFWKLFGELKAQYMKFHRFWSHGGRAADSDVAGGQFSGFSSGLDESAQEGGGFGQVLGGAGDVVISDADRRERALLAAEARKVGTEPPVRNFLAGTGQWVMLCPCGQAHDPTVCQNVGELEDPGREGEKASDNEDDSMDVDADASGSAASAATEEPPSAVTTAAEEVKTREPSSSLPTAPFVAETKCDAPSTIMASPQSPSVSSSVEPVQDVPALTTMDLEALGLDSASVWIQRFAARLETFRNSRQESEANRTRIVALELLLKLITNIVNRPNEEKFRRIKADNPRVRADLLSPSVSEDAEALLTLLGFETNAEFDGARIFHLRDAAFDCVRLKMGQELLQNELRVGHAICA